MSTPMTSTRLPSSRPLAAKPRAWGRHRRGGWSTPPAAVRRPAPGAGWGGGAPGGGVVAEGAVIELQVRAAHHRLDVEGGAVQRHGADPRARTLLRGDLRGGVEQRHQVGTGGVAHQHEARRVGLPAAGQLLGLGQGAGHVVGLGQWRGVGEHAVVGGDQHHALGHPAQGLVQGDAAVVLVAIGPATAVDHEDHRSGHARRHLGQTSKRWRSSLP